MKRLLHLLFGLLLVAGATGAQAQRAFNQAELDALLAPIALYPDPLLNHILNAAVYPQDVASAAAWARANPQLEGDAALATVQGELWHPSVKALVAYPEVLIRIAESPAWLADLGQAYLYLPQYVDATVQQLRSRAAASGYLRSDEYQSVYQQGPAIVVQPVYPQVAYVRYYDPFVVYGGWWWPAYRPAYFRPWAARPVIVRRVVRPVVVVPPRPVHGPVVTVRPYRAVPESRRMPIIQSAPAVRSLPAPSAHQRWRAAPSTPPARVQQQHRAPKTGAQAPQSPQARTGGWRIRH